MRESLTPRENGKSSVKDGFDRSPSPQMGNDKRKTTKIQTFFNTIAAFILDADTRRRELCVDCVCALAKMLS
jgi:hypothetical protein